MLKSMGNFWGGTKAKTSVAGHDLHVIPSLMDPDKLIIDLK